MFGIFDAFKKVFDTTDHDILSCKLVLKVMQFRLSDLS